MIWDGRFVLHISTTWAHTTIWMRMPKCDLIDVSLAFQGETNLITRDLEVAFSSQVGKFDY